MPNRPIHPTKYYWYSERLVPEATEAARSGEVARALSPEQYTGKRQIIDTKVNIQVSRAARLLIG